MFVPMIDFLMLLACVLTARDARASLFSDRFAALHAISAAHEAPAIGGSVRCVCGLHWPSGNKMKRGLAPHLTQSSLDENAVFW
jgi:hypothetical protein